MIDLLPIVAAKGIFKLFSNNDNPCCAMSTYVSLEPSNAYCPEFAPFFGFAGASAAMILSSFGAAYGTAKSGAGIAGLGTVRPDLIMRALIPVVMAGIIAVYGLVVAVLITGNIQGGKLVHQSASFFFAERQ